MVLNKLRNKRFIDKNIKKSLDVLEKEIQGFSGSAPLAIAATATGVSWQGVLSATQGLFKNRVFQIPQYYSQAVYSDSEFKSIGLMLAKLDVDHFIFSGLWCLPIMDVLKAKGKRVSAIYHGSHASVLENPEAADHFKDLIDMKRSGLLFNVGFVKKGLDKSFEKHTGLKFHPIHLMTDENLFGLKVNKYERLPIGVLTHDLFRKNIYNMVSAGLMVDGSTVHMKEKFLSGYFNQNDRIKEHNVLTDHGDFLKVLGGMKVNLYVTFSECWGQLVNESLAMGVPCLTSDVSAVLDFDVEMKRRLVVREFDNDAAIYHQLIEVLEDVDWYRENGPAYITKLNRAAQENMIDFTR